jgi:MFS family permease
MFPQYTEYVSLVCSSSAYSNLKSLQQPNLLDYLVSPFLMPFESLLIVLSVQAFVTFGLACFTGALFDKFGHRPLIAAGTFSLALGFCILSLCTRYWQMFIVHATLIAWGCNLL